MPYARSELSSSLSMNSMIMSSKISEINSRYTTT